MEKNLRLGVQLIDKKYSSLLSQVGCENPSYIICLDPSQGSGFIAENDLTRVAMEKVSSRYSSLLSNSLVKMSRCFDRTYKFSRS